MGIPRDDADPMARIKALEETVRQSATRDSGEVTTFYQATAPALPAEDPKDGALWFQDTDNQPYRWDSAVSDWTPVRDGAIVDAQTDIDELNNVTLPALQTDLGAAQTQLDTLTDTTLPALQTDLGATQTAVATLTDVTLPALQTDLSTTQTDVASAKTAISTLTDTTLPGLQDELDAAETAIGDAAGDITSLQSGLSTAQGQLSTAQTAIDTLNTSTLPTLQDQVNAILPITAIKISDDAITTPKLAAGAVAAGKIAANAVTATELAAGSVVAGKIAADAVTANELAANAVTANELAAGAVVAGKIAAGTIVAADIAADTITANQLAANAVTANEIAAGAVVAGKLAADSVTANNIQTDAVTALKISAGAITAAKIAADAVTADKIFAGSITAIKLAVDSVTAAAIAAGAITTAKLDAGAVTAAKIAANTITANEIFAGTITSTQLAANAVTATKLAADAIDGKTITGALLRTIALGQRLEIQSVPGENKIRFYSGALSETQPGYVDSSVDSGFLQLSIVAPEVNGMPRPSLLLSTLNGVGSKARLKADEILLESPSVTVNSVPVVTTATVMPYAYAHLNADSAALTSGVWTTLTTWTVDQSSGITYSAGTFTVPLAGRYRVTFGWSSTANAVGSRGARAVFQGVTRQNIIVPTNPTAGIQGTAQVVSSGPLALGGTIQAQAWQNSGAGAPGIAARGDAGGQFTTVQIEYIGP